MGLGFSTWQVLIWYYLKFISTFSLLLALKFLFSQHTQSVTALTPDKLFHCGRRAASAPPRHIHRASSATATLRCSPGFRQPLVAVVSGALPSSLVCCLCFPAPPLIRSRVPQTTLEMNRLSSEPICHTNPKQLTVEVVCPSQSLSPPKWNPVPGRRVGGEEV